MAHQSIRSRIYTVQGVGIVPSLGSQLRPEIGGLFHVLLTSAIADDGFMRSSEVTIGGQSLPSMKACMIWGFGNLPMIGVCCSSWVQSPPFHHGLCSGLKKSSVYCLQGPFLVLFARFGVASCFGVGRSRFLPHYQVQAPMHSKVFTENGPCPTPVIPLPSLIYSKPE